MALSLSSQAALPTTTVTYPLPFPEHQSTPPLPLHPPATSKWTYLVRSESSSFEFDPSFSPDTYSSIYFPATDTRLTVTPTISFTPAEPTCDVQCREEQQRLDDEE
ncbi:hypothetical protein QBC45DRAFT_429993 [Copromyces sp. CBS 386.78]|nr:hypothetical protein QBC45DRAFT_429993 [Copromyces sp. CBS 386.78]